MDKILKKIDAFINEGEERIKNLTLYHGVKDKNNVPLILKSGFKLIYIKPQWANDYAISAVPSKKDVINFFGKKDVTILQFKFRGNVYVLDGNFDSVPTYIAGFPSKPQDYTRNLLDNGIDAVELGGSSQFFIYNVKKISNIKVVS